MDAVNRVEMVRAETEENRLRSLYLFYGKETFLIDTYLNRIKKSLILPGDELMNLDETEGRVPEDQIINSAETFPFMAEKRLVIVHDSGFFASKKKENDPEGEEKDAPTALMTFLSHVPETTVLIFVESDVDKRNRLYKALDKSGLAVEFEPLSEDALARWIGIEARRRKLKMDKNAAFYLLRQVGSDMNELNSEMEKLFSYRQAAGVVTNQDIDQVVTVSLETNIFHMMDAIGNQRAQEAFRIYRNLIITGENENYIFAMLRRQIDLLYKTSIYKRDGLSVGEIMSAMGQRDYVVRKNLQQASRFSQKKLEEAMEETLKYDTAIKTGGITPGRAIELLIAKYGSRMSSRG